MKKREFLVKSSQLAVLASFGLTLDSCSSDEEPSPTGGELLTIDLTVSPFNSIQSDGGWVLHPDQNILLVNVGGLISAFSSVCTHQGCSRDWSFSGEFICSCHNSRFDTSGNVTQGPATRPLRRIPVKMSENTLQVG